MLFFFFQCLRKSKLLENTCARSIQIPADRSKTAMSKCPVFPMTRSVSAYGPLDKEDTGGQKLIPTGSLPTTLQGATVCILVFLKIWTLISYIWFVSLVLNSLINCHIIIKKSFLSHDTITIIVLFCLYRNHWQEFFFKDLVSSILYLPFMGFIYSTGFSGIRMAPPESRSYHCSLSQSFGGMEGTWKLIGKWRRPCNNSGRLRGPSSNCVLEPGVVF